MNKTVPYAKVNWVGNLNCFLRFCIPLNKLSTTVILSESERSAAAESEGESKDLENAQSDDAVSRHSQEALAPHPYCSRIYETQQLENCF